MTTMATGMTAAKTDCISKMMNPNPKPTKIRGNQEEVRFGFGFGSGLWKKNNPNWPSLSLITKTNQSHVGGSLRSCASQEQQQIIELLNTRSSRQRTVPVIQVLLEDNNGLIWNELNEICDKFCSSNESKSTSKSLLEIMQLLLRHDKSSIHRKIELIEWFRPPDNGNKSWLASCYEAEYMVGVIRMIGKLFRLLKWGRNCSTVFIRLTTYINNADVCMEEFRNCLAEHEDGEVDVDQLFSQVCKGDNIAMHLSSTICLQPRVLIYASAEHDFDESPLPLIYDSAP